MAVNSDYGAVIVNTAESESDGVARGGRDRSGWDEIIGAQHSAATGRTGGSENRVRWTAVALG